MRRYTPALMVLCIFSGIIIGIYITYDKAVKSALEYNGASKVDELMQLVHMNYVDSISMDEIIETAMPKILADLDPHSTYIPAKEVEATNADLKSSFSGIGVRFVIEQDTLHITDVIRGGPSEQVGLLAGDRLITVNDTLFVGEPCTNEAALSKLKGPKGSCVKLGIQRYGSNELLHFNITRGDIPLESIEVAYTINDRWGYILMERFAENTFSEFIISMIKLLQKDCKGVIIDVRGNGGGYLGVALQIANEFLGKDDIIVYTEGVHQERIIERANGYGNFQQMPLIILTDEISASASEILAGTVQDNDRGTIIGRRTFGKGLVQQPFEFSDGSAARITVARYYTPSGRCIQKPYTKGEEEEYAMDIVNRYERGEFFSQDSIQQNDSLIYKTKKGRVVYGGGGIMPDIFVSSDTADITSYFTQVVTKGLIRQYTFAYSDKNRRTLSEFKTHEPMVEYLKKQNLLNDFISYADSKGIKARHWQIEKSKSRIERSIYSYIIYNIQGMLEHTRYINKFDPTVKRAIEILENEESFPVVNMATE